jgi:hypothetical protein
MPLELTEPSPEVGPPEGPEWAIVRDFLVANSDRLRDDRELLADLGLRLDAANVVDFGPVALSRASAAHRRESSERQRLEAMARANFAAQTQTHAAVIDVMNARSLCDLANRFDELARRRFGLTVGVLALEGGDTPDGWFRLVEGQTTLLMGDSRSARLGRVPTSVGLFGAQAPVIQSVALARLSIWEPARASVMAFGSVDPDAFAPDMGAELVIFLAGVVERTAERWPRP